MGIYVMLAGDCKKQEGEKTMRIQFDKGTVCINTKKGYREIRFGHQQPMYWSKNFYYKVTKSIKLWLFYTSHDTMRGIFNMNRENNKYINEVGEVLDGTEMLEFVKSEAKRQYEDFHDDKFESLSVDEQQECILDQFKWQLDARGWKVHNNGTRIH